MSLVLQEVGYESNEEDLEDIEYLDEDDYEDLLKPYRLNYKDKGKINWSWADERIKERIRQDCREAKVAAVWGFPKDSVQSKRSPTVITDSSTPAEVEKFLDLPPDNSARDLTKRPRRTEYGLRLHFNTQPYATDKLSYCPEVMNDLLDLYRTPEALKAKKTRERRRRRRREAAEAEDDLYRATQALGEKRAREVDGEDGGLKSPSPSKKGKTTEEATEAPVVGRANSPQTEGEEEPRPLPSGRDMRSRDGRQRRIYTECG